MAKESYDEIRNRAAAELTADEMLQLSEELATRAAAQSSERLPLNLIDLRGLGKSLWQGTSPDQYVAGQRDSWDG